MVKTTITIDRENTFKELQTLKYKYDCKSINEVISKLLLLFKKFKLQQEFQQT